MAQRAGTSPVWTTDNRGTLNLDTIQSSPQPLTLLLDVIDKHLGSEDVPLGSGVVATLPIVDESHSAHPGAVLVDLRDVACDLSLLGVPAGCVHVSVRVVVGGLGPGAETLAVPGVCAF